MCCTKEEIKVFLACSSFVCRKKMAKAVQYTLICRYFYNSVSECWILCILLFCTPVFVLSLQVVRQVSVIKVKRKKAEFCKDIVCLSSLYFVMSESKPSLMFTINREGSC